MAQEPVVNVWPGASTYEVGKTPFGYFDSDPQFLSDIDKFASWAATRLGYPVTDVELIDINFYSAYEEAIVYFGQLVNSSQAKDILLDLKGSSSYGLNLSGKYYQPTLKGVFKLAKQYGIAGPAGGSQNWYSGCINVQPGKQVYDLTDPSETDLEVGTAGEDIFTIKKIFHNRVPANKRLYGTYTSSGIQNNMADFGFDRVVGNQMIMMPLNYSLQMMQAVELNDEILKSSYSFKLTGTRLQIFPIPNSNGKIWFNYTLDDEYHDNFADDLLMDQIISDISNIPFQNLNYTSLNHISKHWIKKYALALCKEMLGLIRSKYQTLPIPDSEITLNGDTLLEQARTEQETLTTELKELLESLGHQAQMEKRTAEADALQNQLSKVPTKIYIR